MISITIVSLVVAFIAGICVCNMWHRDQENQKYWKKMDQVALQEAAERAEKLNQQFYGSYIWEKGLDRLMPLLISKVRIALTDKNLIMIEDKQFEDIHFYKMGDGVWKIDKLGRIPKDSKWTTYLNNLSTQLEIEAILKNKK